MTLPFQENNNSRRFQCFVCGVEFTEYEEYKTHILEKHEKDRDYIQCPVPHCQAPVRCLRTHFKVKHPQAQPPKEGLLRAIVWRDFLNKKGNKKKVKFREGYYESTKMGKQLHYRSGWEAQIYECLDAWNQVVAFEAEPFAVPYIYEGEKHDYIPDLFIAFMDGRKEVWEIKPSAQTSLEKNKNKWHAAHLACQARGWEFVVVTEKFIGQLKNLVKNQYFVESDTPDADCDED